MILEGFLNSHLLNKRNLIWIRQIRCQFVTAKFSGDEPGKKADEQKWHKIHPDAEPRNIGCSELLNATENR